MSYFTDISIRLLRFISVALLAALSHLSITVEGLVLVPLACLVIALAMGAFIELVLPAAVTADADFNDVFRPRRAAALRAQPGYWADLFEAHVTFLLTLAGSFHFAFGVAGIVVSAIFLFTPYRNWLRQLRRRFFRVEEIIRRFW